MNTTTRVELKTELGLGTVKQITTVRKALGHPDWQNSSMSDLHADEVRLYFTHIRINGFGIEEALQKVVEVRSSSSYQDFDSINPDAIDHSQNRDGEEEESEIVLAVNDFGEQVNLAMTDVSAEIAERAVDSLCIGVSNNIASKLRQKAGGIRKNFGQVTHKIRSNPLNLTSGSLEKKQVRQIRGLY